MALYIAAILRPKALLQQFRDHFVVPAYMTNGVVVRVPRLGEITVVLNVLEMFKHFISTQVLNILFNDYNIILNYLLHLGIECFDFRLYTNLTLHCRHYWG